MIFYFQKLVVSEKLLVMHCFIYKQTLRGQEEDDEYWS